MNYHSVLHRYERSRYERSSKERSRCERSRYERSCYRRSRHERFFFQQCFFRLIMRLVCAVSKLNFYTWVSFLDFSCVISILYTVPFLHLICCDCLCESWLISLFIVK